MADPKPRPPGLREMLFGQQEAPTPPVGPFQEGPPPAPLAPWQRAGQRVFDVVGDLLRGGTVGAEWTGDKPAAYLGEAVSEVPRELFGGPVAVGMALGRTGRRTAKAPKQLRLPGFGQALDLGEEARQARATRQGYGPVMFHETASERVPDIYQGFRTNIIGASRTDPHMPFGTFLKPTEGSLGTFESGEVQLPVRHRAERLKEFPHRQDLEAFLLADPEYRTIMEARQANYQYWKGKADELNDLLGDNPSPEAYAQAETIMQGLNQRMQERRARFALLARQRSTKLFEGQGYQGIRVRVDPGSEDRFVDTTVVFNPSHIRSPEAAFHPGRLKSKNLLASLVAGTAAGFGMRGGEEDQVATPPPVLPFARPGGR